MGIQQMFLEVNQTFQFDFHPAIEFFPRFNFVALEEQDLASVDKQSRISRLDQFTG